MAGEEVLALASVEDSKVITAAKKGKEVAGEEVLALASVKDSKVIIAAVLVVADNIKIFIKILIIRDKILLKCSGWVANLPPYLFHPLNMIFSLQENVWRARYFWRVKRWIQLWKR